MSETTDTSQPITDEQQANVINMATRLGMGAEDLTNFVHTVDLMRTMDSFSNPMARLGFGTPNMLEGTEYPLTRLSRDYMLMQSLYRSNWIARKLIDAVAEDMCKNRFELHTQVSPEQLDDFDEVVEDTQTATKILDSLKWARLFGGAVAVMLIDGHEGDLDKPLDVEDVELDSYKGLLVLDRWSGVSPGAELITDINSPEFGLPEKYRCTVDAGGTFDVHSSRILRFIGRGLPSWERMAEMGWGISEIELVYDELKKRDNTSWNIASLIFRANIFTVTQDSLASMLTSSNQQAQQQLYNSVQQINHLMSNQGLMVLPKDGHLEQRGYTFSGINDVYQSFMLDICGAAEIPMTRLFGRTISGLGQGNEGDEQVYYDTIGQKQNAQLRPALRKLLPVIGMSTWGKLPRDLRKFQFPPVRSLTNEEMSKLANEKTTAIVSVFNAGLVGRQTSLKELRQGEKETGMWSNITDEMIEEADDEVQNPADMMGGGMPGFEGSKPGAPEGGGKPGAPKTSGAGKKPEAGKEPKQAGAVKKATDSAWRWLRQVVDEFIEQEHPRNEGGEFSESGSSGSSEETKSVASPKPSFTQWLKSPTLEKTAVEKYDRVERLKTAYHRILKENNSLINKNENAACAALIMSTGIRPGSEKDTHAKKKAYGATTLEGRHVVVEGNKVSLQYVGKEGVDLNIPVDDPKLKAMLIKRKQSAGENGRIFQTKHGQLLDYAHTLDGGEFKIKDFRTRLGTTTAEELVSKMDPPKTFKEYVKSVRAVASQVAQKLGNTPVVCLQHYISPTVFLSWRENL